jgi:hypothetical protein
VQVSLVAFTTDPVPQPYSGGLECLHVGRVWVMVEPCEDAPGIEDSELRRWHDRLMELAAVTAALLPARYGSYLHRDEVRAFVRRHHERLESALEDVRERVQMTVRVFGSPRRRRPSTVAASTGREYLERKQREMASPELSHRVRPYLRRLHPFVVRERTVNGTGSILATAYHLVDVGAVAAYVDAAARVGPLQIMLTGPWPPFAFTPDLR